MDCPEPGKCCFNGCGLKCFFSFGVDSTDIDQSLTLSTLNQRKKVLELQKNEQDNDETNFSNQIIDINQFSTKSLHRTNKKLLSDYPKLAKCPSDSILKQLLLANSDEKTCNVLSPECQSDADCPGMQMCCGFLMSQTKNLKCSICVYSQSTTRK